MFSFPKIFTAIVLLDASFSPIIICTGVFDFSELCITSKAEVSYKEDIKTTATTAKAKGSKCSICWKIKEISCDRANCAVN